MQSLPDLIEILSDGFYQHPRWLSLKNSADKSAPLLLWLSPLMEFALKSFKKTLGKCHIVSDECLISHITDTFLSSILALVSRVLVLEMHALKQAGMLVGENPVDRFMNFTELLREKDNASKLLQKYPLLKSLLESRMKQYLTVMRELFLRLKKDYKEITSRIFSNDSTYQLVNIEVSGDRHREGRAVMVLTFTNAKAITKIVYKPRTLAVDIAFQALIEWYNLQNKHSPQLFTFTILNRKKYGWVEFVSYQSCQRVSEIKHFYYRMGVLMMLVYLLGGSDLHAENIIAHGEYPVIIDVECLMRPHLDDNSSLSDPPRYFVTDTFFLPHRIVTSVSAKGYDISALSGDSGELRVTQMQWKDAGTDAMTLHRAPKKMTEFLNRPQLKKSPVSFLNYGNDFLRGYKQAYQTILKQREFLLKPSSLLNAFRNVETRVILRNTSVYLKLLQESYHPLLLIDQTKRKEYFMYLAKQQTASPLHKIILSSELDDLLEDNIPAFYGKTTSKKLVDSRNRVLNLKIRYTGFQAMLNQLRNYLGAEDLTIQCQLIENSIAALQMNNNQHLYKPLLLKRARTDATTQVRIATLIKSTLDKLNQMMIRNRDRIFWPSINLIAENTWNPAYTDIHLYNGIAGIMLSFAYAGKILNNAQYTATANECLSSLRSTIAERGKSCFSSVGGYSGLGGMIYAFASLYHLWGDGSLENDIAQLCKFMPELIHEDQDYDIISGVTGALAALISARQCITPALFKRLTRLCVMHLLDKYPEPSQVPLLGFSHGVAGMVWALSKYHALFPDKSIYQWIQAGLSYERCKFSPKDSNWPDLRKKELTFMTAWCHGAAGIGLARCDMKTVWHDDLIDNEIASALKATLHQGFTGPQNLCHGSLGNLELLLNISRVMPSRLNAKQFSKYRDQFLSTIELKGLQCESQPSLATPGLMTGMAGVAYQLLRFLYPECVPSVLLLAI